MQRTPRLRLGSKHGVTGAGSLIRDVRRVERMHRRIPTAVSVAILLVIAGALAGYAYFGDTSIRQSRRMKLAREYLPAITNAVHSHSEFRDVRVGVGTGAGGCFLVVGVVDTQEQSSKLQSVISATKPPVRVLYSLKVLDKSGAEPDGAANGSQPFSSDTNRTSSAAGSRR